MEARARTDGKSSRPRRYVFRVLLVVLFLLVPLGAWAWFTFYEKRDVVFHGFVQGDVVFVASEEAGRIAELAVVAAQEVKAGQLLFVIDSTLEKAARDEAAASLSEARARLERAVAARERPEELDIWKARERRARAALTLSEREFTRSEDAGGAGTAAASRRDRARAQRDSDQASLDEVRLQIAVAGMGARSEEVQAARAAVAALEARLAASQSRLDRRQARAAIGGIVQEFYFRIGEVVPPGRPVVSLLPPENVKVRFFVGQAVLAKLAVVVHCDGCEASVNARIQFISPKAEFTPPIIYSNEERSRLVFMVEAVPQPPQALRPGQPVTVALPPLAGSGSDGGGR